MADYYTLLTEVGRAKLANAQALGTVVQFSQFAVGDGGGAVYNPTDTQTALVNENYRAGINQLYTDTENPSWLVAEVVIPENTGGWYIREAGVFDADGDLIVVAKYPETYKPTLAAGSGKDLYIRLVLEYSNTGEVELKIDPAIVLATRKYVDDAVSSHAASRNHPAATTDALGFVELATQTEVNAGTDNARAITPAGLHQRTATTTRSGIARLATDAEAKAHGDATTIATPAGVFAAFAQYGLGSGAADPVNIDNLGKSGVYYTVNITGGVVPAVDDNNGVLLHLERDTNNGATQLWFGRDSTVMFMRTRPYPGTTWTGWTDPRLPSTVGLLAFCRRVTAAGISPGTSVPGSDLVYSDADNSNAGYGPSGTWECLGWAQAGVATLYRRIA